MASHGSATMLLPSSDPYVEMSLLGSGLTMGTSCPPLRPEAPQPGSTASKTVTAVPRSARCKAVDKPV